MNSILLLPEDFETTDRVRLAGRRLAYVRDVHRARKGDELRVGVLGGRLGRGTVTRMDEHGLELEVCLDRDPPAPRPRLLVLAVPRPLGLRRVLISASSLGVKRIVLLHARRVEKSFWQSGAVDAAGIREQLVLGLEQARDTILPSVELRRRFRPFVEDELPERVQGTRALVADPDASEVCPRHVPGPVTLAIGPEGGWVPYEIERLVESGLTPVRICERVLRTETVLPALLGRLF